tara:strand:- start:18527 stop:18736 length:210 start_codon:yes stop_codon:yes gene_type:complete
MTEENEDKPKLGWGGPRVNQDGRPPLPDHLRRVQLRTRVLPETIHILKKDKQGMGKAIDKLVRIKKKKT